MKCPKCGYNSFEYLDNCKKCNTDLVGFKVSHGIKPTILPATALAPVMISEDQQPEFSSPSVSSTGQESDEFSWNSPEEQSSDTGAFSAMGLDLPPDEPDHFNFSLDLPEAETEPEAKSSGDEPFEGIGTGGNDFFAPSESAEPVQMVTEEPAPQEETPFGELSFDDLYGGEPPAAAPVEPAADEPLPDFFGTDAPPAGEPLSDDDFGSLLEIERNADGSAPIETADAFDADPFQVENTAEDTIQGETREGEVDLMGLSPEEYESLFGEAPKKKKPAPKFG